MKKVEFFLLCSVFLAVLAAGHVVPADAEVFVAESAIFAIQIYDGGGTPSRTISGEFTDLAGPADVAIDDSYMYVANGSGWRTSKTGANAGAI